MFIYVPESSCLGPWLSIHTRMVLNGRDRTLPNGKRPPLALIEDRVGT